MEISKTPAQKKRTVKLFAFASFLNDFGSDIVYAVWPIFVMSISGANMAVLGLIDGLGDALISISKAVSGYYSDKLRKRKIFVWLGYFFGGLSRVGYAFAPAWQWIVPFRALDRSGKIRSAPRDAIIADISSAGDRGKNFGILKMADHAGAFLGIIFAIGLFPLLGYQKLFLLAAIPSLIGAIFIVARFKEKKYAGNEIFSGLRFKDMDNNFRLFTALSAIFSLGAFSYSFLMVFANKFGFEAAAIPVLYLIFTAAAAITSLPFARLSDRIKSRKKVLLLSYLFWILVCAIFILVQTKFALILAFILYGAHKGALDAVQKALICEIAPEQYRASCLGAFQLVVGICALPASLIAGLLWAGVNPLMPFSVSIALTALSGGLMFFVKEKIRS
jgi:Major Facilitator Superfamily.